MIKLNSDIPVSIDDEMVARSLTTTIKAGERLALDRDIEKFIQRGGKIQCVAAGNTLMVDGLPVSVLENIFKKSRKGQKATQIVQRQKSSLLFNHSSPKNENNKRGRKS